MTTSEVLVLGGGHNALVAATYLARAGLDVEVLEAREHVGGAAVSERPFGGVDVRLSRYSYLVSLLPDALTADLGLDVTLADRSVASCTPYEGASGPAALLVTDDEEATTSSFAAVGAGERAAWDAFYADADELVAALAPTLLGPLPDRAHVREAVTERAWRDLVERPLGEALERRFASDVVRGVVATDALIGTFASMRDESLAQNRCFLYHVLGGPWRVPVGGMGALTGALERVAREAGARITTSARVTGVQPGNDGVEVTVRVGGREERRRAGWALSGVAPAVLDGLVGGEGPVGSVGITGAARPVGSQLKLNMVLERLPRLRSGVDPELAFAGTFHTGEAYADLERVHAAVASGTPPHEVPGLPPGEVYCHTLTDRSILGPELDAAGVHTLTYFGLHVPSDAVLDRDALLAQALAGLDVHLEDRIEDLLLRDADGRPCIEVRTPLDIEAELGMPGGHIFHGDLSWPWREDGEAPGAREDWKAAGARDEERDGEPSGATGSFGKTVGARASAARDIEGGATARAWGVATGLPRVLVCGSGSVRGGAVSGLGGHSAAHALLEILGR